MSRDRRLLLLAATFALFITLLMPVTPLTAFASPGDDRPIGIISAFKGELEKIVEAMDVQEVVEIGQWTFYIGEIKGVKVVVFYCGVGKVNAAAGTELLIQRFNPRFIIFSGIAGGVARFTNIGDITISFDVAQHDYGKVVPIGGLEGVEYPEDAELARGFVPAGVPIYKGGEVKRVTYFRADPGLIELARKASSSIVFDPVPGTNRTPVVRVGTIVTGDQFIASSEKVEWLYKVYGALSTEMEGGAVAQVAYIHDIPWVIIRTNSDRADDVAEAIIVEFWQYAAENSAKIVVKMVELWGTEQNRLGLTIPAL
jgi:adenosylhomocysteine nucleosidase